MSSITIPANLRSDFGVSEPARVCDENGNVLGYYIPVREATDEDYEWLRKRVRREEIEASLNSGPCRPASEVIAELRRNSGVKTSRPTLF